MNAPLPYVVVAGLARCGTSLTMQMLHAGGIPCIGAYPDFEVDEVNHRAVDPAFLAQHPGHAFKVLNPQETPLPTLPAAVLIWLDRDPEQQARSQAKFAHLTMGVPVPNRAHLRRWESGLRRDRGPALAQFGGWLKLLLNFEDIIAQPLRASYQIAARLSPWWPDIDFQRMAALSGLRVRYRHGNGADR